MLMILAVKGVLAARRNPKDYIFAAYSAALAADLAD
jgi:hypothetical protein